MKSVIVDNNPYLLIENTDQPQLDINGDPIPNPNYGQVTTVGEDDPPPEPVNAGNPYFGKSPLLTKDFFALVGQALGVRYPRLRNDASFLWVYDVLTKIDVVDVDDRGGQFLKIVAYLGATNAADGSPLLSNMELATIMTAWR